MSALVIKQILKSGYSRSWKVRDSGGQTMTFGSAKTANIKSLSSKDQGIEFGFYFKNGKWIAIDLNTDRSQKNNKFEYTICHMMEIQLSDSKLIFELQHKPESLSQSLLRRTESGGKGSEKFILAFKADQQGILRQVKLVKTIESSSIDNSWTKMNISLENQDELSKFNQKQMKQNGMLAGAFFIALFGLMLIPSKKDLSSDLTPPPKSPGTVIQLSEFKKMKPKTRGPASETKSQPVAETKDQNQQAKGKIAGFFRNVTAGRVSTLLGKVSATAARSSNVVVSNGIVAGTAPSGRALAALGNVDRAGSDWSQAKSGHIQNVNTISKNGTGTGGFGKLQAGSTGQGGVGLIEEESEIVGGLDRDVIAGIIKNYLGQILYCYERQLSAHPDMFGKVSVKFTIAGNGAVETQAIADTTLKNATVEGCMLNKVATWKFPAPNGGTRVNVTYPFLFKSTN